MLKTGGNAVRLRIASDFAVAQTEQFLARQRKACSFEILDSSATNIDCTRAPCVGINPAVNRRVVGSSPT